ncbi:MAG: hypothetical protein EPO68_12320 [Planctomycetota bacterium]|nr:MAG: hypothetical protein EPO68_12320 [Planctomycetota bacterium]
MRKFMLGVLVVFASSLVVAIAGVVAMIWGREPRELELRIYGTAGVIAGACVFVLAASRAVHDVRRGSGAQAHESESPR